MRIHIGRRLPDGQTSDLRGDQGDVAAGIPSSGLPAGETAASVASDIEGRPDAFEGLYLELDSADGKPMGRLTSSDRSGAGRIWYDPTFHDIGVAHG